MATLDSPTSTSTESSGSGVRAVVLAPTRELAHQIHNECLKLAVGRKWRIILFSKATASTLADKKVRDKVGELMLIVNIYLWPNESDRRYYYQHTFTLGSFRSGR